MFSDPVTYAVLGLVIWLVICYLPANLASGFLFSKGTGVIPAGGLLVIVIIKLIEPYVLKLGPVLLGVILSSLLVWVFFQCFKSIDRSARRSTTRTTQ